MKLKKRYFAIIAFLGLFGTCRMDFLQFRSSDAKIKKQVMDSGQAAPDFHSFETEGQPMHYVHVGADTLPLVLLVHGAPGSSNNMVGFLKNQRLTDVAQVIAVDRPGYGYSGFGVAERSLEKQAAALKAVIGHHFMKNKKRRQVILLGHSLGAPVIARMAMDCPELVDGLVIVAGSIAPELEPKKWYQKPLDWAIFRWMLPPAARVCNQEILPLPGELEKMLPLWKKITCPVTLVHGTEDQLVPFGNVGFAKKMLLNSSGVLIDTLEGKNHFILWSEQERMVDHIIDLIKKSNQSE